MYKLWVSVNEQGAIIDAYGGYAESIGEPLDAYTYFFEVSEDVFKNMGAYQVVDGALIKR
jgi:hypothetical protein